MLCYVLLSVVHMFCLACIPRELQLEQPDMLGNYENWLTGDLSRCRDARFVQTRNFQYSLRLLQCELLTLI